MSWGWLGKGPFHLLLRYGRNTTGGRRGNRIIRDDTIWYHGQGIIRAICRRRRGLIYRPRYPCVGITPLPSTVTWEFPLKYLDKQAFILKLVDFIWKSGDASWLWRRRQRLGCDQRQLKYTWAVHTQYLENWLQCIAYRPKYLSRYLAWWFVWVWLDRNYTFTKRGCSRS